MRQFFLALSFFVFSMTACSGQNTNVSAVKSDIPVSIIRFDKDIYRLVEKDDSLLFQEMVKDYPEMFSVFGKGVLNMQSTDIPGFQEKLVNYFSEPTLWNLYGQAIEKYADVKTIESQIGDGFAFVQTYFPTIQLPAVYTHVSGLNQNILVGEQVLSISIDKYMGQEFPLYQDFFYEPERRLMTEKLIAPDCIAGLLLSEYPFEGNENVLLDRMIYEGKIKYLLEKAFPDHTILELIGYDNSDFEWCQQNEKMLWRFIVGNKQLFTPDHLVTARYFQPTPSTFLADGAPGNIGIWLGWRIVTRYMNETNATPLQLMQAKAQEVLSESKYKP